MDLLAIFHALRRHKVIVLVVFLLTMAGNAYIVLAVHPQYQTTADYVFIGPPPAPTDAQIAKNPALGKLNSNNPYLQVEPSVVAAVLSDRMDSDAMRRSLVAHGADPNYTIAVTNAIGTGQVVEITGTGDTAGASIKTLNEVADRMKSELLLMQSVNGANARFFIQAVPVDQNSDPAKKITGTLRSLVIITVAGVIVLFGALSVADAARPRRARPRERRLPRFSFGPRPTPPTKPTDGDGAGAATAVVPSDGSGSDDRPNAGESTRHTPGFIDGEDAPSPDAHSVTATKTTD